MAWLGASVTLRSTNQGFTRTYTTDANGSFRAVALPLGSYEATGDAEGYNSLTDTVSVSGGGTASVTFTVGSSSAATTVDEVVVVGVRQAVSAFDATTTERPYQRAMTFEQAKNRINELKGIGLDPGVVDAFNRAFDAGEFLKVSREPAPVAVTA